MTRLNSRPKLSSDQSRMRVLVFDSHKTRRKVTACGILVLVYTMSLIGFGWNDPIALVVTGTVYLFAACSVVLFSRPQASIVQVSRPLPRSLGMTALRSLLLGCAATAIAAVSLFVFRGTDVYKQLIDRDREGFQKHIDELEATEEVEAAVSEIERRLRRPCSPEWRKQLQDSQIKRLDRAIEKATDPIQRKKFEADRDHFRRAYGLTSVSRPRPKPNAEYASQQLPVALKPETPVLPLPITNGREVSPIRLEAGSQPTTTAAKVNEVERSLELNTDQARILPAGTRGRILKTKCTASKHEAWLTLETQSEYVLGLTSVDFSLAADGHPVAQLDVSAFGGQDVNVLILFDLSSSMESYRTEIRRCAERLIRHSPRGVVFNCSKFANQVSLSSLWNRDPSQALTGTAGNSTAGSTLRLAVVEAAMALRQKSGRRIILVFSDTENNLPDGLTDREAVEICQESAARLWFVRLPGNPQVTADVRNWVVGTKGRLVPWTNDRHVADQLVESLRTHAMRGYYLRYQSQSTPVEIKVGRGDSAITLTAG